MTTTTTPAETIVGRRGRPLRLSGQPLVVLLACTSLTVMANATISAALPSLRDHFRATPAIDTRGRPRHDAAVARVVLTAFFFGWLSEGSAGGPSSSPGSPPTRCGLLRLLPIACRPSTSGATCSSASARCDHSDCVGAISPRGAARCSWPARHVDVHRRIVYAGRGCWRRCRGARRSSPTGLALLLPLRVMQLPKRQGPAGRRAPQPTPCLAVRRLRIIARAVRHGSVLSDP